MLARSLLRRKAWPTLLSGCRALTHAAECRGAEGYSPHGFVESSHVSAFPAQIVDSARRQIFSAVFTRGLATKAEEYDVISIEAGLVVIEGYDARGFFANNAYVEGSVMCAGSLMTLWKAESMADVTPASLSLLLLMRPAPDLFILGCGERMQPVDPKLQDWLAGHGIALECLNTANAVSTFNILNQESRKVAAALLPCSE